MLRQIQRIRPNFGTDDTLLGHRTGEFSYIPEEFVPHTIVATLSERFKCELTFEYPTDESPDRPQTLGMGMTYIAGKYTNKVIKIILEFNSSSDLVVKAASAAKLLEGKKYMLAKDSYRRNYDLASEVLETFAASVKNDADIKAIVD